MSRRRPKRIAASLPRMLATVPSEPEHGERRRRRKRGRCRAGRGRDESQEGDAPSAQRAHLERVDAVDDRVGHGRAVAQHRAEIEQRAVRRRARPLATRRRGTASATSSQASARACGRGEEGRAASRRRRARRSAQAKDSAPEMPMLAACPAVARDIILRVDLVGEQLEAGHVGAGPADAGRAPARRSADQNPSANRPNSEWPATVSATPKR